MITLAIKAINDPYKMIFQESFIRSPKFEHLNFLRDLFYIYYCDSCAEQEHC